MRWGQEQVYRCSKCSGIFRRRGLASGNDYGATYWSDFKCQGASLPDGLSLGACPHCNAYLWVASLTSIGSIPEPEPWFDRQHPSLLARLRKRFSPPVLSPEQAVEAENLEKWKRSPTIRYLETTDYIAAIDSSVADTEKREIYLRTHIWWGLNDPFRDYPDLVRLVDHFVPLATTNLKRLAELLGRSTTETVWRAEIARELGQFSESVEYCATALKETEEVQLRGRAEEIKAHALAGNSAVFKLESIKATFDW